MNNNLLKLVIVDDEDLSRDLIKRCVNWKEYGFEIIGEFSGAREAIGFIKNDIPDAIITDICMPQMDGIEFSRIVLEQYPDIKIIVLTGHDDFAYAKESLKLGIFDFLLKPVDYEEMENVAEKVKKYIVQEKLHKKEYIDLKNKLKESLPHLKEKFFNELVQFNMNFDNVKEKLEYFNIDIKEDVFRVAVFEVQDTEDVKAEEETIILKRLQIMEMFKRYFENSKYINIFFDNSQRIVLLCNDINVDLIDVCEIVKNNVMNRVKCVLNIGIGNSYDSLSYVFQSYKEAIESINYKVVIGKNQIICFDDIVFSREDKIYFSNDDAERLGFYIKTGLHKCSEELISKIYTKNLTNVNMDSVKIVSVNIISVVLRVISDLGLRIESIYKEYENLYNEVFVIDNIPDMYKFINKTTKILVDKINLVRTKKVNKVITDVIEYLKKNFADHNLSIGEVARNCYLSPNYLSRIFKKDTGYTMVEYLTKIRMEKAALLLKSYDLKAYQVARKVGILDPHYFSICFKKFSGMTISEYRKS